MVNDMDDNAFFSVSPDGQENDKEESEIEKLVFKNNAMNFDHFEATEGLDKLLNEIEKLNSRRMFAHIEGDEIVKYHEFCNRYEFARFNFINKFLYVNNILPYDNKTFESVIEPLIPECTYDEKSEIFDMNLSFIPYLKFDTLREFVSVKNVIIQLIMEGVKRLPIKPNYDKEAVLIVFTLQSPYEFDLDNIEVKYIIDALRYSGFFYDDSCKYVSYLVQGNILKEHPLVNVKIIKKSSVKFPN